MADSKNPELSIIILNFNVKDLLLDCLDSIFKNKNAEDNWQIIVVDNASEDGSVEELKKRYKIIDIDSRFRGNDQEEIKLVENKENLGFSAGNNVGLKKAKAPVVLFLNPDTMVVGQAIQKTYRCLMSNPDIGAITCRVELPNGQLDYSSHRGFPTPWNSLTYFLGLAKLFPRSPIFAGYTATFLDTDNIHEIDCLTGAFMMVRKIAGEQINWWDTDYFWNGEDIEFCYSLKKKGWKIFFYPGVKIIHYKGSSSGLKKTATVEVEKSKKLVASTHGVSAMRIFYKKHYYEKSPPLVRELVLAGIKILEHYRKFKIKVKG